MRFALERRLRDAGRAGCELQERRIGVYESVCAGAREEEEFVGERNRTLVLALSLAVGHRGWQDERRRAESFSEREDFGQRGRRLDGHERDAEGPAGEQQRDARGVVAGGGYDGVTGTNVRLGDAPHVREMRIPNIAGRPCTA